MQEGNNSFVYPPLLEYREFVLNIVSKHIEMFKRIIVARKTSRISVMTDMLI